MIWVHRLGEILGVATCTGVWGIVVIPKMASCTIIRYRRMRPFQSIIIIVNIKGSRFPARFCAVTTFTVCWKTQGSVIRVGRLIECPCMTAYTIRRRIGKIAPRMALGTIQVIMSFGQWEKIVIYRIRIPIKGVNTVAINTIGGKTSFGVIWIRTCFKIAEVTTDAIIPYSVKLKFRFRKMTIITTQGGVKT